MLKPLFAALAATVLIAPAPAQRADRPLGELLDVIPDEEEAQAEEPLPPPPPRPSPRPLPRSGIGTTDLPPSTIEPMLEAEPLDEADAVLAEGDVPALSEEEIAQARWEAEEALRLEALDRAREARAEAARLVHEAAVAEHERQLAEREDAIARDIADYEAELERRRAETERRHREWEARVRACQAGDRAQCARPGEY